MAASSSSTGQHVVLSITAPPAFLASANWSKVHAALAAQLPLKNLHWKSAFRQSVRTIQELDATILPFEATRDEHTSQIPCTVLEKPLLHIYVVHCEDNDVETYRTTLKKQIKEWHLAVTSRKHQEWLILQIIRPESSRPTTGNFFQIKGSVLDKLRTDFNTDKRDRCVQINWITGNENPQAWAEFINKVKESIVTAFDGALGHRLEEVKRSESQQQMPGWNFCTFFILKESVASSFEGMNLHEEALTPYNELEESFSRVSKEKNMSWFGSLINHHSEDDSSPLLSTSKKPYRDLILANNISVFDMRVYLLARQCQLLAKMGQVNEITSRVSFFLGSFGKRLRDVEAMLPPLFIEAWAYSSALSAVERCDEWCSIYKIEQSKTVSAGKAQLLDVARTQLDIIGIEAGHLPEALPFSIAMPSARRTQSPLALRFSNPLLNTATQNKEAFYELYVATTNRAIDLYAKSGRRKFALKLYGNLAALEIHRGNLAEALNTYSSLPAHYAPHMWTSLESFMLSRALDVHSQLSKDQDFEWIHIVLSFLKTFVDQRGAEMLMHEDDKHAYVEALVKSLRKAADRLETDLPHPDHPALTLKVSSQATLAETRDGAYIDVTIHNHLPCEFAAEEVNVTVAGRETEKFRYSASILQPLKPGKSKFTLFCPMSPSGTFILDSSEICSSHLLFQSSYRKVSSKSHSSKSPTLVRVPKDFLALNVRISQSNHIELGKSPALMVVLFTGRNGIDKLSVRLSCPSVTFRQPDAKLLEEDLCETFEATAEGLRVTDVDEDSEISFLVPHSDASAFTAMKVNVEVEYVTDDEPDIKRISRFSKVLVTALPISVNVEDFFRGTKLVSKFTVSTTSHQHIRIADAALDLPPSGLEGVTVASCSKKRSVFTVTPLQPANFLFAIESLNGPVRESLTLRIKYRMLREEVESIVEETVRSLFDDDTVVSMRRRIMLVGRLVDALESDAAWVEMYGITGELNVPIIHQDNGDSDELLNLKKAMESLSSYRHPNPPRGKWREIKIPVDVPYMNIVAAVNISPISTPFAKQLGPDEKLPLYAGQPISAELSIDTSFHWGAEPHDTNNQYLLRWNIEEMIREWLVSGPKRGDFVASNGGTHTVPVTLIALHHGEFHLPRVSITAHPVPGPATMGSITIPSIETYQVHGAKRVLVLPRGGRSTFVVNMGSG